MITTYTAHCERSGHWWAIDVPEVRGVFSQARSLTGAGDMAREAIALMLDVAPDSFDVVLDVDLGDDIARGLAELAHAKAIASHAAEVAAAAAAKVAADLTAAGLTMRDAGVLMGLSHQRIGQLLQDA